MRTLRYAGRTYVLRNEDLMCDCIGDSIMPFNAKPKEANVELHTLDFAIKPDFFAIVAWSLINIGGKVTFSVTRRGTLRVAIDHPSLGSTTDVNYINDGSELNPFVDYLIERGIIITKS